MATKLLLLQDVEDLGRSGEVVAVRPGFARNYLLPRGFGIIANKQALRMQARLQEERHKKALEDKQEAETQASHLSGITVQTTVKVDHEGHMYGSVSIADIVELLREQASTEIEKRALQLKHPIKEVGVHTIHVKLKEGVATTFTVKVVPEGSEENQKNQAESE